MPKKTRGCLQGGVGAKLCEHCKDHEQLWIFYAVVLAILTLIVFFDTGTNFASEHVRIWCQGFPIYTEWAALGALLLVAPFASIVHCMQLSQAKTRVLVTSFFSVLGIVCIGLAALNLRQTYLTMAELRKDCGKAGLTKEIEAVWQRADDIYTECDRARQKPLFKCPNLHLDKWKPADRALLEYLEETESDFHCSAFCQKDQQPLFLRQKKISKNGCAWHVGGRVALAGRAASVVAGSMGLFFFAIGLIAAFLPNL
uniref:Uncharacterized protein n=1 Tax=Chromera velia CCMP2878 TaxID=1169474 RepID=A0A0G4FAT6_9ALVE|mmetsp:Transcript_22823/g.44963  ORF Transcript_22823/g.44963 Transcript_22823/m.44963 type:complete len:256 (+) Transcript_22823:158-925(+)|eukprot:Cvel_16053.t1-p1 / transcript=Cvel_16053.t1 / gene=Cvel_16053 / organism=Chromera_velia_CCMP2878 / gene_product=hypothetical protein / transcript_product=hypothetical protein / location=Cvel_scaffold1220:19235-22110(+) / protein_length=255 / sequence_SO=supercontig / SO=protein_coding / is_pseudo=false